MTPFQRTAKSEQIASLKRQYINSAEANANRRDDVAMLIAILVSAGLSQIEIADNIGQSRSNLSRLASGEVATPANRYLPRSRIARAALVTRLRDLLYERITVLEADLDTPSRPALRTNKPIHTKSADIENARLLAPSDPRPRKRRLNT